MSTIMPVPDRPVSGLLRALKHHPDDHDIVVRALWEIRPKPGIEPRHARAAVAAFIWVGKSVIPGALETNHDDS